MVALALSASVCSVSAQEFEKGDKVVNLGVGVGIMDNYPDDETSAAFTQRLSIDWCVADKIFDKGSIGVGFALSNAYGGNYTTEVRGAYDYTYTHSLVRVYRNSHNRLQWDEISTNTQKRSGNGSATADLSRNDLTALVTASFHYQFVDKLDTYLSVGVGATTMFHQMGGFRDEEGFLSKSSSIDYTEVGVQSSFSYNDLDHVDWNYSRQVTCVRPAFSASLGARYRITDNWAANMEVGLLSAQFSKKYGQGLNLLSIGASYKF